MEASLPSTPSTVATKGVKMIGDGSVPIGLGIRIHDMHIYDGVGLRSPQAADTEIAVKIVIFIS
eukprot:10898014-Ditylum_brightwellii.AAC.1